MRVPPDGDFGLMEVNALLVNEMTIKPAARALADFLSQGAPCCLGPLAKHAPLTVRPRINEAKHPKTCKRVRARYDGGLPMAKAVVRYDSSYGHSSKISHTKSRPARARQRRPPT